ncbi:PP2C family protein-serine/threonine phosphatase [Persicirhabdus sediminis]|uniref:SpoIIE family protein phosphatase n=1 Tax=Persicirhabdus sediminis TaxID=454144 RepID=A0A8J7SL52_9BACT|nr:GAF domain-containing SpoIIE family protein phosphatase [Persicirhabdus sediminis]MBK1792569.1 SpoIIE family protein phosphatase [Persicirhabdus sediminis]
MSNHLYLFFAAGFGLLAITLIILEKTRRNLQRTRSERDKIEGEEKRMLNFLHHLGVAIEEIETTGQLYRKIVDGVAEVLEADGGAMYLLDIDRDVLVPKYISKDCPPLVGLPVEVLKRAEKNDRVIASHVRLAKQSSSGGVLGACLAADECILVEDIKNHPSFRDAFVKYEGNVSALLAPLKHSGRDLGVLAVAKPHSKGAFTYNDRMVFSFVTEQSSFAMGNAMMHAEASQKRKIEAELRTAQEVQRVLLPQSQPQVPGYRISGINLPAQLISGDYFDFFPVAPGYHGVVIADVTGKGVPAGLLMAMCRSVLRSKAGGRYSPTEVLSAANRLLFPDIREDMFISLAYLVLEFNSGRVSLSRAGHDAPLHYKALTEEVVEVKPPGLALGIDEGDVFDRVTSDLEIQLESADCLLLYTDGVCEAEDENGEQFGEERMKQAFMRAAPLGAEEVVSTIRREVESFAGDKPQLDDITLVAIEKRPSSSSVTEEH